MGIPWKVCAVGVRVYNAGNTGVDHCGWGGRPLFFLIVFLLHRIRPNRIELRIFTKVFLG